MPPYSRQVADWVEALRPGGPPGRFYLGGPPGLHAGHGGCQAERDRGFPICGPEAPWGRKDVRAEPVQGRQPVELGSISDETDEERTPVLPGPTRRQVDEEIDDSDRERPEGVWVAYQGRASHHRLGTNVPMQIELFWTKHRVSGTWFMRCETVDVVVERSDDWHLIMCAASGGTRATLSGKWVAPNSLAGEFCFGADGGGTFELLQCPPATLSADPVSWASSGHSGSSSTVSSLGSLPIYGPPGYCVEPLPEQGTEPSVRAFCTEAAAKEADSQRAFATEVQLATALVHVLRMHPNGIPLAQLKTTIHRSAGLWVCEAFLGYKKLCNLIKSPAMSKACWTKRIGSCDTVFGYETAAGGTRAALPENTFGKQHADGIQGHQPPPGLQLPPGTFTVMPPLSQLREPVAL